MNTQFSSIVIATANLKKGKELILLLEDLKNNKGNTINWQMMNEFNISSPNEDGLSFVENALIKARHCAKYSQLPSIADDSGICCHALNGLPGIYSARYAGEQATDQENIEKLLTNIKEHKDNSAYFYCAIAFVEHFKDPTPIIAEGYWQGKICKKLTGNQGFGYDPIFFANKVQKTVAAMNIQEKAKHSHRSKAILQFKEKYQKKYTNNH